MQTRKLFRGIVALLAGVATLGVAACDDTDVVETPQVTTLSVSPTGPISLTVGQSIQIVASAQNATGAVSFTSSNPAVATVNATTGAVTAVSAGTTSIIATVGGQGGGTVQQAVQVTVTAAGGQQPIPGDTAARIQIVSVVDGNNNPVPLQGVTGNIFVRVDYTRGTATALEVRINNTVACRQTFGTTAAVVDAEGAELAAAAVEFVCPINTARADSATGAPTFPQNTPVTITAVLLRGTSVIASAATQQYTFANQADVSGAISAPRQAVNPRNGLTYRDGDVTVTAATSLFPAGTAIGRISVQACDARVAGRCATQSDTSATGGFSVVFPEGRAHTEGTNPGLQNFSTDSLVFTITAVTTAGQQFTFPSGNQSSELGFIRYDNVAPTATNVQLPNTVSGNFVGSNFTFTSQTGARSTSSSATANEVTDPGLSTLLPDGRTRDLAVDNVTVTFSAIPATTDAREDIVVGARQDTLANAFGRGTQLTGVSGLQENTEGYIVIARVQDALQNTTYYTLTGGAFRLDVTPPTLGRVRADNQLDGRFQSVQSFSAEVSDNLSGFGTYPVEILAVRTDTASATNSCFIGDEGGAINPSGISEVGGSDSSCEAVPHGLLYTSAGDAYTTYTIRAVDQAGNRSADSTFTVVVDLQNPSVSQINFPAVPTGGSATSFSARLNDNLDLDSYVFEVGFNGLGRLPFQGRTSVDNSFGTPLTTQVDVAASMPFINGIQVEGAGVAPANEAVFTAIDKSQRSFSGAQPITSPGTFDGVTNAGAFDLSFSGTGTSICTDGSCDPEPNSRVVTARVTSTGPAGSATPFQRVYFFARINRGGGAFEFRQIGMDEAASLSVTNTGAGNVTTFAYDATLNGAAVGDLAAGTAFDVIAIGVDADGDGLSTEFQSLTTATD